jgi:mRNA-degrading endonuclease toxin of MazEF toxin-antitoxin module
MPGHPDECRANAQSSLALAAEHEEGERRTGSKITVEELRKFAYDCRMMALATNNADWDRLAERWLRCADDTAVAPGVATRRAA